MVDEEREHEWQQKIDVAMKRAVELSPLMQEPQVVQPGSALAGDDARFELMPTSNLAWVGLMSAIEHFHASALLWNALNGGTMPSAYSSLLRPVLVGAGQACWLLAPPQREERVHRTLLLALEETKHANQAVSDIVKDEAPESAWESPVRTEARRMRSTYAKRIDAIRAQIEPARAGEHFTQTAMISAVAADIFPTDPRNQQSLLYLWRVTSGDAHSLLWPKISRIASQDFVPIDNGRAIFRDVRTYDSLATLVLSASKFVQRGLDLHEQRRTKHY